MSDNEVVLSVVDDPGIRDWLGRVMEAPFRLEFVGCSDLSRAVRMLEATTAHVVLVEIREADMDQSLAIITALTSTRPWVTVITVCTRANQEMLLQSMRSGARDCFLAGNDAGEIRDRLRRHQLVRPGHYGDENLSITGNLTLVTAADSVVDTRFLTQSLACGLNLRYPRQRVLAIDTQTAGIPMAGTPAAENGGPVPRGGHRGVFYLDANREFTLKNLLANPETLDDTLIDTALEEFRPGLRLLSSGGDSLAAEEDYSADLFIALNRLMQMFDHIVINVAPMQSRHWVRALGIHTRHLLVAMHPLVQQAHAARDLVHDWRAHLGRDGRAALVVDAHDSGTPPRPEELRDTVGIDLAGALPLDWRQRLLAINSGLPIQEQSPNGTYSRAFKALLDNLEGTREQPQRGLLRRLAGR